MTARHLPPAIEPTIVSTAAHRSLVPPTRNPSGYSMTGQLRPLAQPPLSPSSFQTLPSLHSVLVGVTHVPQPEIAWTIASQEGRLYSSVPYTQSFGAPMSSVRLALGSMDSSQLQDSVNNYAATLNRMAEQTVVRISAARQAAHLAIAAATAPASMATPAPVPAPAPAPARARRVQSPESKAINRALKKLDVWYQALPADEAFVIPYRNAAMHTCPISLLPLEQMAHPVVVYTGHVPQVYDAEALLTWMKQSFADKPLRAAASNPVNRKALTLSMLRAARLDPSA